MLDRLKFGKHWSRKNTNLTFKTVTQGRVRVETREKVYKKWAFWPENKWTFNLDQLELNDVWMIYIDKCIRKVCLYLLTCVTECRGWGYEYTADLFWIAEEFQGIRTYSKYYYHLKREIAQGSRRNLLVHLYLFDRVNVAHVCPTINTSRRTWPIAHADRFLFPVFYVGRRDKSNGGCVTKSGSLTRVISLLPWNNYSVRC